MTRRTPAVPVIDEQDGVLDEVQAWYLAQAEAEGMVYTRAVRQLINRMYRDRDYQAKRRTQGKHTAYDWAVERDQKAVAWVIRALVRYVPPGVKAATEPPKPPRTPARRLSPAERAAQRGHGPSWNGQPKRDWAGPTLPPTSTGSTPPRR
jgi:hypothetical protein